MYIYVSVFVNSMDATLVNTDSSSDPGPDSSILVITGQSKRPINASPTSSSTKSSLNPPDLIWQKYNVDEFLSMSSIKKRDLLRASGVTDLPRPREGEGRLNELLMGYMDSSVRNEYQQRLSQSKQSTTSSSSSSSSSKVVKVFSSRRHELLQLMAASLESSDTEQAASYREEFARLTRLRADPTQEEGAYDRFLDQGKCSVYVILHARLLLCSSLILVNLLHMSSVTQFVTCTLYE